MTEELTDPKTKPDPYTPGLRVTVFDENTEVACLQQTIAAGTTRNFSQTWDGKWGVKEDGTDTQFKGRYVDPKKYTIKLFAWRYPGDPNTLEIKSDLHVVRLGVQEVHFPGTMDSPLMSFHRTTTGPNVTQLIVERENFELPDAQWRIPAIDYYNATLTPRTAPYTQLPTTGESFTDLNNNGAREVGEDYYDENNDGNYNTDTRRVNFPLQKPTADPDVTNGAVVVADTGYAWNYPVTCVKNTPLSIIVRMGRYAKSDTATVSTNVNVGYDGTHEVCPAIKLRAKYNNVEMTVATEDNKNIRPYIDNQQYSFTSAVALADSVGFGDEIITFSYQYDDDGKWVDIPGSQSTTHMVYRLAARPTTQALSDILGGRLRIKIVDFSCDWGMGQTTSGATFNQIWEHLWTPFAAAPITSIAAVQQWLNIPGPSFEELYDTQGIPANVTDANAFHGFGDRDELSRVDELTQPSKCYTYEHWGNSFNADSLLDLNQGSCGAWNSFFTVISGIHGYNIRSINVWPKAFRSIAPGNALLNRVQLNALAVGDEFYMSFTGYDPVANNYLQTADHLPITPRNSFYVNNSLDGQAHSHTVKVVNSRFQNIINGDPTLRSSWGDGHAICYYDHNDNQVFDTGDLLFDPSYQHSAGLSLTGYPTVVEWQTAAMSQLRYRRFQKSAVGNIIRDDGTLNTSVLALSTTAPLELTVATDTTPAICSWDAAGADTTHATEEIYLREEN